MLDVWFKIIAVTPTPFINPNTFTPARFGNLSSFINVLWPLLTTGAALLFGAMFLYMGFLTLTAGPDKDRIEQAKKTLQYAILGLIIIMFAYLIVQLLGYLFNITIPI